MKESLQRIVAWAKAHPYYAAAILVGVIFLAWLTYRRGGFGGGDSGAGFTPAVPGGDNASDPLSTDGSGGLPPLPGGGSGGGDLPSDSGSGGGSGGGDLPAEDYDDSFDFPPPVSIPPVSFPGIPAPLPSVPAVAEGAALSSNTLTDLNRATSPARSTPLTRNNPIVTGAGAAAQGVARMPAPNAAGATAAAGGVAGTVIANVIQAVARVVRPSQPGNAGTRTQPARARTRSTTPTTLPVSVTSRESWLRIRPGSTPAQAAGRSSTFTGTYNGVRYIGGYPVGSADWSLFSRMYASLLRPAGGNITAR